MSDYSYFIVHEHPPRPRLRLRTWLLSWLGPVTVWTKGRGADWDGTVTCRRPWFVERGKVTQGRINHTCSIQSGCECITGRES